MAAMDDGRPGEGPGERRLARPPSERYVAPAEGSAADGATDGRAGRWLASLLAGAGAVVITIAGGLLSITAGLLVIAGALGWAIAVLSRGTEVGSRRWLAPALASSGVALGQVGLWLVARQEGGTLDPIAYLGETFGVLVPLQLAIAAVVAWWQAR
jgi:hypothetical protein